MVFYRRKGKLFLLILIFPILKTNKYYLIRKKEFMQDYIQNGSKEAYLFSTVTHTLSYKNITSKYFHHTN